MDINKFRPRNSTYLPEDYVFKAWAYDIALAANSYTPVSGNSFTIRLRVDKSFTITNVLAICSGAGSGLTGAYAAIYQNGTLIGQSADQKALFTSAGGKTVPLTAPIIVQKGYIDVMLWFVGTTPPNIGRAGQLSGIGEFLTGTNRRFAATDTGLTTTAPSTLGTKTALGSTPWVAIS